MQQQTIYMCLLDEGADVWRPVQAIEQAPGNLRQLRAAHT